ncbi:MAG: c-type cytochrome [Myxococcota bacterium]
MSGYTWGSARLRSRFALIFVVGWLAGCNDYSQVRASLDPAERVSFDRGQREATPCWSCHDLTGQGRKIGPPLGGFFGRPAARAPDYPYSPALEASGLVWNEQTLGAFLEAPQRVIPGNRMLSPPLTDAARRADLVFFLSRVSRSGGASDRPALD